MVNQIMHEHDANAAINQITREPIINHYTVHMNSIQEETHIYTQGKSDSGIIIGK